MKTMNTKFLTHWISIDIGDIVLLCAIVCKVRFFFHCSLYRVFSKHQNVIVGSWMTYGFCIELFKRQTMHVPGMIDIHIVLMRVYRTMKGSQNVRDDLADGIADMVTAFRHTGRI